MDARIIILGFRVITCYLPNLIIIKNLAAFSNQHKIQRIHANSLNRRLFHPHVVFQYETSASLLFEQTYTHVYLCMFKKHEYWLQQLGIFIQYIKITPTSLININDGQFIRRPSVHIVASWAWQMTARIVGAEQQTNKAASRSHKRAQILSFNKLLHCLPVKE